MFEETNPTVGLDSEAKKQLKSAKQTSTEIQVEVAQMCKNILVNSLIIVQRNDKEQNAKLKEIFIDGYLERSEINREARVEMEALDGSSESS